VNLDGVINLNGTVKSADIEAAKGRFQGCKIRCLKEVAARPDKAPLC